MEKQKNNAKMFHLNDFVKWCVIFSHDNFKNHQEIQNSAKILPLQKCGLGIPYPLAMNQRQGRNPVVESKTIVAEPGVKFPFLLSKDRNEILYK